MSTEPIDTSSNGYPMILCGGEMKNGTILATVPAVAVMMNGKLDYYLESDGPLPTDTGAPGILAIIPDDNGQQIFDPRDNEILPASVTNGEIWEGWVRCNMWFMSP